MQYDYSKLLGRIREVFGRQEDFAMAMDKDPATISKKLNNLSDWTRTEIVLACELLGIPLEEVSSYFFCGVSCEITTKPHTYRTNPNT